MKDIQGRVLDYILTTEGRHISPHQILNALTETYGVEQFKVMQKEDLSIEVRIKAYVANAERTIYRVQEVCRVLFGETPLDVKLVERMENAEQKYRVVESRATT
jgi:hypothetical protein